MRNIWKISIIDDGITCTGSSVLRVSDLKVISDNDKRTKAYMSLNETNIAAWCTFSAACLGRLLSMELKARVHLQAEQLSLSRHSLR